MKIAKLVIYSVVLIIMFLQDFAIAQSSEKLTDNIEHHSIATKRVDHKKMESYRGRLSQDMAQVISAKS